MKVNAIEQRAVTVNNSTSETKPQDADGAGFVWINKPGLPKHLDSATMNHAFPSLFAKTGRDTYVFDATACGCSCDGKEGGGRGGCLMVPFSLANA